MRISLTRKNQFHTTIWQGGTTTELGIYPINSVYKLLNFDFRISTSTVDLEETIFSALPGVERKILVLEGTMRLEHLGHRTGYLKKFDTDAFSGEWQTRSYGRCTDFNLMTRGETTGTLTGIHPEEGIEYEIEWEEHFNILGFYLFRGKIKIVFSSQELILEEGDMLIFYPENSPELIKFLTLQESEVVLVKILTK